MTGDRYRIWRLENMGAAEHPWRKLVSEWILELRLSSFHDYRDGTAFLSYCEI